MKKFLLIITGPVALLFVTFAAWLLMGYRFSLPALSDAEGVLIKSKPDAIVIRSSRGLAADGGNTVRWLLVYKSTTDDVLRSRKLEFQRESFRILSAGFIRWRLITDESVEVQADSMAQHK